MNLLLSVVTGAVWGFLIGKTTKYNAGPAINAALGAVGAPIAMWLLAPVLGGDLFNTVVQAIVGASTLVFAYTTIAKRA